MMDIRPSRMNCQDCNKPVSRKSTGRCKLCSQLKNALNRKLERPKCLDCKKELISLKSEICKSCSNKRRWKNIEYKQKMIASSKAKAGKRNLLHSANVMGSKNPFWKGGITSLARSIRNLSEYNKWRKDVFARDNYTCQMCFKKGIRLEADHINQFAFIFKKFLDKYNIFSAIEDKETLLKLSTTYEYFWDISNGRTLCKECHKTVKVDRR